MRFPSDWRMISLALLICMVICFFYSYGAVMTSNVRGRVTCLTNTSNIIGRSLCTVVCLLILDTFNLATFSPSTISIFYLLSPQSPPSQSLRLYECQSHSGPPWRVSSSSDISAISPFPHETASYSRSFIRLSEHIVGIDNQLRPYSYQTYAGTIQIAG